MKKKQKMASKMTANGVPIGNAADFERTIKQGISKSKTREQKQNYVKSVFGLPFK